MAPSSCCLLLAYVNAASCLLPSMAAPRLLSLHPPLRAQIQLHHRAAELRLCAEADAPAPPGPRVVTKIFTLRVIGSTVGLVGAFTACFAWLEGWSLIDALYFTTSTLSTIGFGDLRPAKRISRVLTSLLGIAGVGLLGGLVSATLAEFMRPKPAQGEGSVGDETRQQPPRLLSRLTSPALRLQLNPFAQVSLLFGAGVLCFKACEPTCGWAEAAYLIIGSLTTAGSIRPTAHTAWPQTSATAHHTRYTQST